MIRFLRQSNGPNVRAFLNSGIITQGVDAFDMVYRHNSIRPFSTDVDTILDS
jgi:hypothetical protein